jgi:hypothetical protein
MYCIHKLNVVLDSEKLGRRTAKVSNVLCIHIQYVALHREKLLKTAQKLLCAYVGRRIRCSMHTYLVYCTSMLLLIEKNCLVSKVVMRVHRTWNSKSIGCSMHTYTVQYVALDREKLLASTRKRKM